MISWLNQAIFTSLLVVTVICMAGYHVAMFGWWPSAASVVESLNYGSQTITTVGYGNWIPADLDVAKADAHRRILLVKAISIPFTLVGGGLFAVIIGIVANFVSEGARSPRPAARGGDIR